jgi:hypothetical protein
LKGKGERTTGTPIRRPERFPWEVESQEEYWQSARERASGEAEVGSFSSNADNTSTTLISPSALFGKSEDVRSVERTSETRRAMIPTQSRLLAYAIMPQRDKRPYEGFNPTTPQYAAGSRTDPPVSDPSALVVDSISGSSGMEGRGRTLYMSQKRRQLHSHLNYLPSRAPHSSLLVQLDSWRVQSENRGSTIYQHLMRVERVILGRTNSPHPEFVHVRLTNDHCTCLS